MRRSLLAPLTVLTVLLLGLVTVWRPGTTAANLQTPPESDNIQFQVSLEEGVLPLAPAWVYFRRILIDPNGEMPLHAHSGVAFYQIESGTLTARVSGKALLLRAATESGTPAATDEVPLDEEFRMRRGDVLITWAQTPKTYRNTGERPTKILAGFLLPAGHQRPETITYLNGASSEDIVGVGFEVLGEAVAPVLPTGASIITVDRLQLDPGEPVPAYDGPMMLSLVSGTFDFSSISGEMQISRADRSVTVNPLNGTAFSLARGDALFLPYGLSEVPRADDDGEAQLLRWTIAGDISNPSATPVANAGPAVIEIAGEDAATPAAATEEAEPTEEAQPTEEAEPTEEPEEEETPEPTATPEEETGTFSEGDIASATDDGVNVRSAPSTSGEVVTALTAGQQVVITGSSEEADGYIWWPVQLVDDESVSGYVAEDFLELVEE